MRKNSCCFKYDWLDIFSEPVQLRVTPRIRIRHYDKDLFLVVEIKTKTTWQLIVFS